MDVVNVAISLLSDAKDFLRKVHPTKYSEAQELLFDSSIGQHTRHFIEFFQCLLAQTPGKVIDYDARTRNHRIETDPIYAVEIIEDIIQGFQQHDLQEKLVLESCYNPSGEHKVRVETSFERELVYNIEHCIHHMAIIKIGLKIAQPKLELPAHFGVAPSTVRYRNQSSQTPGRARQTNE